MRKPSRSPMIWLRSPVATVDGLASSLRSRESRRLRTFPRPNHQTRSQWSACASRRCLNAQADAPSASESDVVGPVVAVQDVEASLVAKVSDANPWTIHASVPQQIEAATSPGLPVDLVCPPEQSVAANEQNASRLVPLSANATCFPIWLVGTLPQLGFPPVEGRVPRVGDHLPAVCVRLASVCHAVSLIGNPVPFIGRGRP